MKNKDKNTKNTKKSLKDLTGLRMSILADFNKRLNEIKDINNFNEVFKIKKEN